MKINEITHLREAKEVVRKQYTSTKEVLADLAAAQFAPQGKSAKTYSSKNVKFSNPRSKAAYEISELSMLLKNNDDLSFFLDKVAEMVGDLDKKVSKPIMSIAVAALKAHAKLDLEKDPNAEPSDDDDEEDFGGPSDAELARQADRAARSQ